MDEKTTLTEIYAVQGDANWIVVDIDGGAWVPDDATQAEIERSDDPAAQAVAICENEPMRGVWYQ